METIMVSQPVRDRLFDVLLNEPGDDFIRLDRIGILGQGTVLEQFETVIFVSPPVWSRTEPLGWMSAMTLVEGVGSPVNVTLVLGCHLPVLVREAGAEEGAAGFLGGFKVAHEVFHESDGEGKFLFRGMRFPFGNEAPRTCPCC